MFEIHTNNWLQDGLKCCIHIDGFRCTGTKLVPGHHGPQCWFSDDYRFYINHIMEHLHCIVVIKVTMAERDQGADSIKRCHLTGIENPIVEIRRSSDRLISKMGFPILVRWHLYIESGPRIMPVHWFLHYWQVNFLQVIMPCGTINLPTNSLKWSCLVCLSN